METETKKAIKFLHTKQVGQGSRKWDTFFENGNGDKVVEELIEYMLTADGYDTAYRLNYYHYRYAPAVILDAIRPLFYRINKER